jgi:hypothetical protein
MNDRINWHEAFFGAIQLELFEYREYLEFRNEVSLTTKPLRIDALIIKKVKDVVIDNDIAQIFRQENIIEFKSPGDHLSPDDLYKTFAYCFLYASINHYDIRDITLTLVSSRHPVDLLKTITEVFRLEIKEQLSGINVVTGPGMLFPVQIIECQKLSEAGNIWLKDLNRGLTHESLERLILQSVKYKEDGALELYLDAVYNANKETMREAMKMNAVLEEIAEDIGLAAKWEARGKAEGIIEAIELIRKGKSPDEVKQILLHNDNTTTTTGK